MTDTPYSPQDFEVVRFALPFDREATDGFAALARIKAHTEGLDDTLRELHAHWLRDQAMQTTKHEAELERMESIVDSYVSMGPTNQEAREMLLDSMKRIAELEAGLQKIAVYPTHGDMDITWLTDFARSLLATTDSGEPPTCPTCGSRDPARSPAMQSADDVDNYCSDIFHHRQEAR